jgi:hypothetical protein
MPVQTLTTLRGEAKLEAGRGDIDSEGEIMIKRRRLAVAIIGGTVLGLLLIIGILLNLTPR